MRVFVTGATGFVGSHVLRCLVTGGHRVAFLCRESSDTWRIGDLVDHVERIDGDLSQIRLASDSLRRFRPETVVHAAWSGVARAERDAREQVANLQAVLDLVDLAHEAGAAHFVGLGSQAEYGPAPGPLGESAPTNPTTLYGITKLSAFHFSRHACERRGLRFAWLRLFSAYGPMDDPRCLIPSLVLQLTRGIRPALTAGEQRWDYLHVRDVATAIVRASTTPEAVGALNLGSGATIPIRAVAEAVRNLVDPALPLGIGEIPYGPSQVMHLEARIDRLRALGWSPTVPLEEGLKDTVGWFLANRERCEP